MSVASVTPGAAARRLWDPIAQPFRLAGDVAALSFKALVNVPLALRYKEVIGNHVSDVAVGAGALLLGAGAVVVIVIMTAVVGIQTSLEGTKGLELIGAEDLVGFVSAYASVREIAPLIAGIVFAAQMGAHFTAELGAMRISEEIDALEVMGLPPVRYLISTRLISSLIVVLPLYVIGLYVQLIATKLTSVIGFGISAGIYDEYFELYLQSTDVLYSVFKVLVFVAMVTAIHCTYGFNASGGPEGVGQAVGRSVRLSITLIFIVNFVLSVMFWGAGDSVRFSG